MMDDETGRIEMSRRGLIKTVGVGIGAGAVGMGASEFDRGPVGEAQAIAPLAAVGLAAGGAAITYLAQQGAEAVLGDTRDYSGYTGAEALHAEVYEGALNMESANERVMTSVLNNINKIRHIALPKGKSAAIEKMNQGASQSEAQSAMQSAIDGYIATIEQNMITHSNAQMDQIKHMHEQVVNHSDLSAANVFSTTTNTGEYSIESIAMESHDYELLDGTVAEYKTLTLTRSSSDDVVIDWLHVTGGTTYDKRVYVMDPSSGSAALAIFTRDFGNGATAEQSGFAYNELLYKRDDVNANLSGFVSDLYSQYDKGDIPTDKLVDPITAATELRQNYDGYQGQGAHAALLGIPTASARSLYVELENDGIRMYADIYTAHVPTDADGNEVGFEVGNSYDPSQWSAPLYMAYEVQEERTATATATPTGSTATATPTGSTATATPTDEPLGTADGGDWQEAATAGVTGFTQIEQPFTLIHAENKDGESIDSFKTEDTNQQTADISNVEEELARIRSIQKEMQSEAQDGDGGGGGGGFLSGDIGPGAAIAAVAGVAGLGFLANQNGGRR